MKVLTLTGLLLGLILLSGPAFAEVTGEGSDDFPSGATQEQPTASKYCPTLSLTMERGARDASTSGQVSELQRFLAAHYSLDQAEIVTGFFGSITQSFVSRFQQEQGLPTFGVAGSLTRAAIAKICGGTSQSGASISVSVDQDFVLTVTYKNLFASHIELVSVATGETTDVDGEVSSNQTVTFQQSNRTPGFYYLSAVDGAKGHEIVRSNTFYLGGNNALDVKVKVLSPNGGESYSFGSGNRLKISWKGANVAQGSQACISLMRLSEPNAEISMGCVAAKNGVQTHTSTLSHTRTGDLSPGTYQARVTIFGPRSSGDGKERPVHAFDESDSNFTLYEKDPVATKSCTISVSPKNPKVNEPFTISWKSQGVASVGLSENRKGGGVATVAVRGSQTFYEYSPGVISFDIIEQANGGNSSYKPICSVQVTVLSGETTSTPQLSIISPLLNDKYKRGETYTLQWKSNLPSTERVDLFVLSSDGTKRGNIVTGAPNLGSYIWKIPMTQLEGAHRFYVEVPARNISANSQVFEIWDPSHPVWGTTTRVPVINSFSATPASVSDGQVSKLSWSSTNTTKCELGYGNGISTPAVLANTVLSQGTSGSALTPALAAEGSPFTFLLICSGAGGTVQKTVVITVGASVSVSVNSLTTTASKPIISGTATGISTIGMSIGNGGGKVYGSGSTISVVNGKWQHQVATTLNPGLYTVQLYSPSSVLLATGSLTISAAPSVTGGSATVIPTLVAPTCTSGGTTGSLSLKFDLRERTPACYGGANYAYLNYPTSATYPGVNTKVYDRFGKVVGEADNLDGATTLFTGYECVGTQTVRGLSGGNYTWKLSSRNDDSIVYGQGTATVPSCTTAGVSNTSLVASAGAAVPPIVSATAISPEASSGITFTKDLFRGVTGSEVRALQQALSQLGLYDAEVTGEFFDATRAAVIEFQKQHGIPATGYVGPATRQKLNELF